MIFVAKPERRHLCAGCACGFFARNNVTSADNRHPGGDEERPAVFPGRDEDAAAEKRAENAGHAPRRQQQTVVEADVLRAVEIGARRRITDSCVP